MNICKNPQSIQDYGKIMRRYDPNQGKCANGFISQTAGHKTLNDLIGAI